MFRHLLLGSICVLGLGTQVFAEDDANILGAFGNWTAYSQGSGDTMSCFAISQPRAVEPKKAKRSAVSLIVTDWPGKKVKAEAEIVPGYEYKDKAPVVLEIGSDKFTFFARNEKKTGSAWLESVAESPRLIDVLSKGVSAVAIGTPRKGARTIDTYSLAGFNEALAKIHAACNM
jgi:hypothetical protein